MANAKQLPSGNWRVKVFSHTDANGKRVYMSFTASTRTQAEMQASKWANNKHRTSGAGKTVRQAIEDYITARTPVLSPATIRSYRNLQKKYYKELAEKDVNKLNNVDVQTMINNLIGQVSEKSIKNIYTLFTASIKFYSKDIAFDVILPEKEIQNDISAVIGKAVPTNDDVKLLFQMASEWMKKCIALAAFSGMRRGEIAALKYKDILRDKGKIFVHTAYAMDENNEWVIKTPKTEGSLRLVNVPAEVIELLGDGDPEEFIIKYNPNTISKMFIKLRNRLGVDIRFHDLRHYYASIGAVLNIPDVVLADFGGWRHDSPVMKNIYQDKITDIAEGYSKKMNDYFSDIINQ